MKNHQQLIQRFRDRFCYQQYNGKDKPPIPTLRTNIDQTKEVEAHLIEEVERERKEVIESVLKGTILRKPTHGICCTCQTCGDDKDDCYCEHNFKEVMKNINSLKQK